MGKIVKLKDKDGNSVLPATIPGAVVDPDTGRTMKGFMPFANSDDGIDIDKVSLDGYGMSVIWFNGYEADGKQPGSNDRQSGVVLQGRYRGNDPDGEEDGYRDCIVQLYFGTAGVLYRQGYDVSSLSSVSWTKIS